MPVLTQTRLKELLDYDPNTGVFTWRKPGKGVKASRRGVAGSTRALGYIVIRVDGTLYVAHRLAWLWVYGAWPSEEIDHKDCDPENNRLSNLRPATSQQNKRNRTFQGNIAGYKGVSPCSLRGGRKSTTRWLARIMVSNKEIYLGTFSSREGAHAAYVAAAMKYFGAYARAA